MLAINLLDKDVPTGGVISVFKKIASMVKHIGTQPQRWGVFLVHGGYLVAVTMHGDRWLDTGRTELFIFPEGVEVSRFLQNRFPELWAVCNSRGWEADSTEVKE